MLSKVKVFVPVEDSKRYVAYYGEEGIECCVKEAEMYCFSKEELEKLQEDAFFAGTSFERGEWNESEYSIKNEQPNFKEYINQLLK